MKKKDSFYYKFFTNTEFKVQVYKILEMFEIVLHVKGVYWFWFTCYFLSEFSLWCFLLAAQLVRNLVNAQQVAGSGQPQGDQPIRTRQSSECVSRKPGDECILTALEQYL